MGASLTKPVWALYNCFIVLGLGILYFSLASQTHFRKRGKGLVNCVYKLCPTGMQLAG